jgi:CheY-like chemotaxis protein
MPERTSFPSHVVDTPRAAPGQHADGPASPSSQSTSTRVGTGRVIPRLVLVEDREEIRETLAELLTDYGFEVATASDGLLGLEVILDRRPAAALLDVGLPGIDGYELARRVRADLRTANLRLIAMTGYGREEDLAEAKAAGFDAHLTKPVDIDDVVATLARLGVEGV